MPTYSLTVRDRFEAAHFLRSYRGHPEVVHGHSWKVEVLLETAELDAEGMGFDFIEIRRVLRQLVARFDHQNINAVPPFDVESPTTEHLARFFHNELLRSLPGASLVATTVWEGPDCSATYRP